MAITLLCKRCRSVLKKIDNDGWFCDECDAFKLRGDGENGTERRGENRHIDQ